jgi:methylated-DNA-[protein]-cysteine S-methyltransferase
MDVEIVETPIGLFKILSNNGYIYQSYFIENNKSITNNNYLLVDDIADYFNGVSTKFVSKCMIKGTTFQKLVWREIKKIPYGTTKTYGEIAIAIGFPNACRAVANACGKNKLALFIPCHRVVGKNNMGGYKWGLDRKKWLLNFEKNKCI